MNADISHFKFTKREREIFDLLILGNSSLDIAESLSISRHTVDTHRRKILKKTSQKNTIELVTQHFNGSKYTQR